MPSSACLSKQCSAISEGRNGKAETVKFLPTILLNADFAFAGYQWIDFSITRSRTAGFLSFSRPVAHRATAGGIDHDQNQPVALKGCANSSKKSSAKAFLSRNVR